MAVDIRCGDARAVLRSLPDESVNCVVTSPPYFGLRDYGVDGQIGLEQTPDAYVAELVAVFREVRRVLRADGTLWLNLGDSYAGGGKGGNPPDSKHQKQKTNRGSLLHAGLHDTARQKPPPGLKAKDLIGIPWRVAFALQADGWWLRQDIIWSKPNPMPESVTDRCTKAHEYLFMLTKSQRYYYDSKAVGEPAVSTNLKKFSDNNADKQRGHGRRHAGFNGHYAAMLQENGVPKTRNKRSVWTVSPQPFAEAHFATFPPALIDPCILAGCPEGGTVLDPFGGAGTTGLVAQQHDRGAILIELNPTYVAIAQKRLGMCNGLEDLL